MKINVGIEDNGRKVLFISDKFNENIGEIEVSNNLYTVALEEFSDKKQDFSKVTDGDYTFEELYYHRMMLFSVVCNQNKDKAWKSWKHSDGTMFDDYFIVGITTPVGDYSYHYHKDYWNNFDVKELSFAPEWDGHKPSNIDRLLSLL